jgi:hypothetical protein|eukprot:COSAG01_NODE_2865_length_6950_cov_5.005401_2_plen_31_part_00
MSVLVVAAVAVEQHEEAVFLHSPVLSRKLM